MVVSIYIYIYVCTYIYIYVYMYIGYIATNGGKKWHYGKKPPRVGERITTTVELHPAVSCLADAQRDALSVRRHRDPPQLSPG